MRINKPLNAQEADESTPSFEPWPAGDYDFIVNEAEEQTSNSGNDMIKLTLHVMSRDNKRRTVFDYLVNTDGGQWKIRHFAASVGMLRQYETGNLDCMDMLTRPGKCKLGIKRATADYPANNRIEDYLPQNGGASAMPATTRPVTAPRAQVKAPAGDLDDEIPF